MRVTLTVDLPMTESEYRELWGIKPGSSGGLSTLAAQIDDSDAWPDVRIEFTEIPQFGDHVMWSQIDGTHFGSLARIRGDQAIIYVGDTTLKIPLSLISRV